MSTLRRDSAGQAMPLNILLVLWMAVGRGLFAPLGWMTVFAVLVSPVLLIFLWMTTRMIRQLPGRELTAGQTRAQVTVWTAMFGFGVFCADGGDSGTTASILMKLLGEPSWSETVSMLLWWGCVIAGPVAWCVLFSKLSRSLALAQQARQPDPYPGNPGPGQVNGHDRPY
ncbi:hypothetical protein BOO86_19605 [Mycobacterium sp. CBMA 234]|uniref:hypothetical protein n=1 Tax=Mycolicibacterium sp. CBMA 234 TaxID=1918495 RepID=UPI0012DE4567|nr:hypothetical protein [Mycolicibacterium sp. CBMA 234]MUL66688.1 hypothetical protein [Mycolicibacterium sp. CBMA 234]